VWAHERTPLANLVRWKDKPVALSIVQARVVGLAHFTVGYILTYAAFLIASTAGKFGLTNSHKKPRFGGAFCVVMDLIC
jgi:photosystem I P700 chlorophyll a apoprotein A2